MANPHRGEVEFKAQGKTWTLKFGTNALAAMERHFGVKIHELNDALKEPGVGDLIALFRIGLGQYHAGLEDAKVGDLIDEVGLEQAGALIGECFTLAFPSAKGEAQAAA